MKSALTTEIAVASHTEDPLFPKYMQPSKSDAASASPSWRWPAPSPFSVSILGAPFLPEFHIHGAMSFPFWRGKKKAVFCCQEKKGERKNRARERESYSTTLGIGELPLCHLKGMQNVVLA